MSDVDHFAERYAESMDRDFSTDLWWERVSEYPTHGVERRRAVVGYLLGITQHHDDDELTFSEAEKALIEEHLTEEYPVPVSVEWEE